MSKQRTIAPKLPRPILDTIFAFPPHRETLGGTSYIIVGNSGNLLIDCPSWNETNKQFLREKGGVSSLFITHRGAIAKALEIQSTFSCPILVQEQEAYLLPGLEVQTFQREFSINSESHAIWTPGHSPGSACLYYQNAGGILFSGRHLLPNQLGIPMPLRTSKTFHWLRQIHSVKSLISRFTPENLRYICPGANTGFLRGKGFIDEAYSRLQELDLDAQLSAKPML
ncbi:MAG: MBL fold metallo-hydrolase [Symploca sp. SIO2B6]|nr:MBL fold metallo-hydrolase [Symploca sp. SIO2B6]